MASTDPATPGEPKSRRWRWIGLAAVIVAAAVLFGATIWGSQGGGLPLSGATGAGVTSPTPSDSPDAVLEPAAPTDPAEPSNEESPPEADTPAPEGTEPDDGSDGPPSTEVAPLVELPAVPLTEQVAPVPGVVFSIGSLEAVDGGAQGPGEVAGPALRFTLTLRNDGDAPVSLTSTVVNVYSGAEQLPAVDLREPGAVPLPAEVGAGESVTGVFVFAVPVEQRDQVKIGVDYTVGTPIVVFEGTAPR